MKNRMNSSFYSNPPSATTTFAFSSVFILLLLVKYTVKCAHRTKTGRLICVGLFFLFPLSMYYLLFLWLFLSISFLFILCQPLFLICLNSLTLPSLFPICSIYSLQIYFLLLSTVLLASFPFRSAFLFSSSF